LFCNVIILTGEDLKVVDVMDPFEREGFSAFYEKWCEMNIVGDVGVMIAEVRESVGAVVDEMDFIRGAFRVGVEKILVGAKTRDLGGRIRNFFARSTLYKALQMDSLKSEFEVLREQGDLEQLVVREVEIVEKVRSFVMFEFDFDNYIDSKKLTCSPSVIVEDQKINCVGQALVMYVFLKELGFKVFTVGTKGHYFLFFVSSDNKVYSLDLNSNGQASIPEIVDADFRSGSVEDVLQFDESEDNHYQFELDKKWFGSTLEGEFCLLKGEAGLIYGMTNNLGLSGESGHEGTVDIFERNDKVVPVLSNSLFGLANEHLNHGSREDALAVAERMIERFPDDADVHMKYGSILAGLGELERALEVYSKSVEMEPSNVFNRCILGDFYLRKLGDKRKALEVFGHAFELASVNDRYRFCRERLVRNIEILRGELE
jgi:hypothetical protein